MLGHNSGLDLVLGGGRHRWCRPDRRVGISRRFSLRPARDLGLLAGGGLFLRGAAGGAFPKQAIENPFARLARHGNPRIAFSPCLLLAILGLK